MSRILRPIDTLVRLIASGDLAPQMVVDESESALVRCDSGDEPVHAFLATDYESARVHADRLARRLSRGEETGVLAGIPVGVKDNLCTLELPTTCGSKILEGYRAPYDATVVRRLRDAGALIVGKTNLDEFGMGSSTEYSAFGPTRNPLDRHRVPGGSSGGSAAAVAGGIVPAALGTETGGSVRQPASFCGVVGIKPTYGRVSRYGLVSFASSLDQVGTFGRTVDDAARLLQVVAGHDSLDAMSSRRTVPDLLFSEREVEGLIVGVPEEYFPDSLDEQTATRCHVALQALEARGAKLKGVSLPHTRYAISTYHVVASAEAASNLSRFDGVRFGIRGQGAGSVEELYERTRALFGPEVKRRVMVGTYVLSTGHYDEYFARANRVRALIARDFHTVFDSGVDVIFTPTTPLPAFPIGERTSDPLRMYLADAFTVAANLAGVPALSVPIGRVEGLPVGGQLMGPSWSEPLLVRVARALESSRLYRPPGDPN